MGTSERRIEIMRLLCIRRHDTISNLAHEFGVSKRTISRDIDILSTYQPIYTQRGKYGGVYIVDGFAKSSQYMSENEISVLEKVISGLQSKQSCQLNANELIILKSIVSQYKKPFGERKM